MKVIVTLLLALLTVSFTGCVHSQPGHDDTPYYAYKDKDPDKLFRKAEHALQKKRYQAAQETYEALNTLYPANVHSERAQLHLIYAYYRDEKLVQAQMAAKRFLHLYPRSAHADYALYMKGMAEYKQNRTSFQRIIPTSRAGRDLKNINDSFRSFDELVRRFPDSAYAAEGQKRMIEIRNLMARHELDVAEFYFDRRAYVAAVNRASYIVQHYQRSPLVKDALTLMVRAYDKMDMPILAQQSLKILTLNFATDPDVKALLRGRKPMHAVHDKHTAHA